MIPIEFRLALNDFDKKPTASATDWAKIERFRDDLALQENLCRPVSFSSAPQPSQNSGALLAAENDPLTYASACEQKSA